MKTLFGVAFLALALFAVIGFGVRLYNALYVSPAESRAASEDVAVGPEAPVRLKIPQLSVDARVEAVGLTNAGKMGAPKSFANVAWFRHGPVPGEKGNIVIAGHLDNAVGMPAVFKDLGRLEPGDEIFVTNGLGEEFRFKVTYAKSMPYDTTLTEEVFGPSVTSSLVLITCEGTWNQELKQYSDRLVVFSILVE